MDQMNPQRSWELQDEWLVDATGGASFLTVGGKTYRYLGEHTEEDYNGCCLCPLCHRPLKFSRWLRFYCDFCDKSWADERGLLPNLESGLWEQVACVEG